MFYLQKYKNTSTLLQRQKQVTNKSDTELRVINVFSGHKAESRTCTSVQHPCSES